MTAKGHAITRAKRAANIRQRTYYVVFEDGEYDVADDADLEGFWIGAHVVCTVHPDGLVEQE